MLNKASKKYLQELRAAQHKVEAIRVLADEQNDVSSQILESHSTELKLEFGPLKMNLKKSRTFSTHKKLSKNTTQSLSKDCIEEETLQQNEHIDQSISATQDKNSHQLGRRVNITI
jgi:hypothetical protein